MLLPILKLFFCSSKKFFSSVLFELSLSFETSFSFLPLPWPESPLPLEASSFIIVSSPTFEVCPFSSIFSELKELPFSEPWLLSVSVPKAPLILSEVLPLLSGCVPSLLVFGGIILTFILDLSIMLLFSGLSLSSFTSIFLV